MRRAPWPVSLLFGASIGLLILLAGPLLLFNPWVVSALQERHDVAEAFGTSRAEIDRVTGDFLLDLFVGGDFDAALAGGPLLDAAERSHMADVSRLGPYPGDRGGRLGPRRRAVRGGPAQLAAEHGERPGGHRMHHRRCRSRRGGGLPAVAFDATFLAFHAIFFPPGTYLFGPGSDLITLFPGEFWFEASLIAGATVVLSAIVVLAIGLAGRRRPPATLAAA